MPITSQIEFTNRTDPTDTYKFNTDDIEFDAIKNRIENHYDATIINTFSGTVTLQDMIASTQQSIDIFNFVQQPIDVLAIMLEDNIIQMSIKHITDTPTILEFARNDWRGITVAVIYGKQTAKFFLNVANHLIKQAGFTTADNEEKAYEYIRKYRDLRSVAK